ncbi:MAG TPA: LytTR family DNA-binding domain-containing protein [Syntrophomonadaceae bacterium]|nr:LytTR family DNA-binding domain-containing protein [Syntrophomonadaceae bacterium]HNX27899.1 LytTR family DNA-binding domain-containing protein [Syntrophomonadaceae bacterium]HPR93175.1 LytTR family DNA-binding domain-containing protein [Syntrophomonadaceae bacterium]
MSVRVLIVDDDERERIVVRYVLEQINDVEIVGEAVHGLEALLFCQEKKVDLVLLDISMPEMGGFETAYKFQALKEPPLFVFLTAKRDMAVEAFELGAIDYIVKPVGQTRIEKTIYRAKWHIAHRDVVEQLVRQKMKERIDFMLERYKNYEFYSNKLPVREKGKITLLDQNEIVYCESQGKKVYISTNDEGYLSNYTLSELESRLDKNIFFRAHQAFIVNLNHIREIMNFGEGSYLLHLNNSDKNIILSRSKAKLLRQKLGIQ